MLSQVFEFSEKIKMFLGFTNYYVVSFKIKWKNEIIFNCMQVSKPSFSFLITFRAAEYQKVLAQSSILCA